MERFFNTAGPIKPEWHYHVPSLQRLDLEEILLLLQQGKYFILHAPRQVGKTSYLLALQHYLNERGQYHCIYANIEGGQAFREQLEPAMQAILGELVLRARSDADGAFPESLLSEVWETYSSNPLAGLLTEWSRRSPKPLVLLIDEIDSLVGDTLISTLRQLRSGYDKRPTEFPHSIILCGVRDIHDYRLHSSAEKTVITGGSAFNIKAKSLHLGDFMPAEMEQLLQEHTQTTGQQFAEGVFGLFWELTQGQPWLINALAYEVCFDLKANRDRSVVITAEMVQQAKETLILRRETHLDQLVHKLQEPRVRRVIEPILAGATDPHLIPEDDVQYVQDLGLLKRSNPLEIANPIYQEIIPRVLTYSTQRTIVNDATWYVNPNGLLDMDKLLTAFQQFFREHSEHWVARFDYQEAGPQLLMQAFLQRIINGGGRVEREYGLGRQRTDLLVIWPHANGVQRIVIELKLLYHDLEATIDRGLAQTWQYMDKCNSHVGHLIIFDRTVDKPWSEKIFQRQRSHQGQLITVWGM